MLARRFNAAANHKASAGSTTAAAQNTGGAPQRSTIGAASDAAVSTQAPAPQVRSITDRAVAIDAAIAVAQPGDVLVIAGKGHENGQIVGREILPFDDVVVAREALAAAGGA